MTATNTGDTSSTPNQSKAVSVATSSRPRTFLLAKDDSILAPASVGPLELDWVVEQLAASPGVQIEQQIVPGDFRAQTLGTSITDRVIVATMPEETADSVRQHPQMVVEEDHLLAVQPALPAFVATDPGLVSPFGVSGTWDITVTGTAGEPVDDATVYLYGSGVPAQGRTDANGRVSLTLTAETDATLRAIYVNPQNGYWSSWINRPALTSGGTPNTVVIKPLSDSFPGFPATQLLGWGQRAMRLDHIPPTMTGHGVKVAVVDSGAAALTHPDLGAIRTGVDLTSTPQNTTQWNVDTIAHGSHCSGIIAGADNNGGVRGFAPAAEVHEARIFPGGRISSLLDAIDYCVNNQIDVVNMSLGTGGNSQILLQKIAQAKELGVACIVAAGNTGGAVQFPGNSPDVFTVAAIGQDSTFPDSSYHAQQRWNQGKADQGYFSAQFSCHGPEVDAVGPGVAIVSAVPDQGFASWDGTSMATPHIAGLAALILAHHPDFQTPALRLRTAARVDRLFELLRQSCTPLEFGDSGRSGGGLPDAVRALGLDGQAGAAAPQASQDNAISTALAQLQREMVAAGLDLPTNLFNDAPPEPDNVPRALAELRAQLDAAGLVIPDTPSSSVMSPSGSSARVGP